MWLRRKEPMLPSGSAMSTLMLRLRLSTGTRSGIGVSHQSISPFCSAADAVAGSGMMTHSMRSTFMTLPPASQLPARCAARSPSNFSNAAMRAGLPVGAHELHRAASRCTPSICLNGSVLAMRSGMMKQHGVPTLPSANSIFGIGLRQHPLDGAVVDRGQLLLDGLEHLAHGVASGSSA